MYIVLYIELAVEQTKRVVASFYSQAITESGTKDTLAPKAVRLQLRAQLCSKLPQVLHNDISSNRPCSSMFRDLRG
jgi:hypothetical protein